MIIRCINAPMCDETETHRGILRWQDGERQSWRTAISKRRVLFCIFENRLSAPARVINFKFNESPVIFQIR